MKKILISFLFFSVAVFGPLKANVVTGVAAIPENYYADVDGKKGMDNILNALQTCISRNYNEISYKGLEPHYLKTDFYSDTLWDMYSTCRFIYEDANKPQSAVCDGWNKEHVCCQSWLGSGPMVSDMFNVYPTDARINNLRSNYPYGVVGTNKGISGDPDHHALGKLGTSSKTGYSGVCYEPDDRYKGDFARTFFYMVARYRDKTLNSSDGAKMFTSSPTNLTAYSLSFLLDWHRNDPVSEKEIDRNQGVYGEQNNRNPFIDYPELVEYIWGTKVGQTVNLASLTPTCEGGGVGPDPTANWFGVTWSVCGKEILVDSVAEANSIVALPAAPASCSAESSVFMGWTDTPIAGTTDVRPTLYTQLNDFPRVTADVTYYAVFAKATQSSSSAPAVYTYDETHQEGWTNTASSSGSYWLLDKGKVLTSPEIDLAGLSSIEVNMRTYGGAQYCKLDISANGKAIGSIEATAGKTLKDYTWTNSASLSGRAPLTFSTNYGEKQGIGFARVTVHATGAGVAYSRYMTSEGSTDIDAVNRQSVNRKMLIDGHLYILVGETIYTITGQKMN